MRPARTQMLGAKSSASFAGHPVAPLTRFKVIGHGARMAAFGNDSDYAGMIAHPAEGKWF